MLDKMYEHTPNIVVRGCKHCGCEITVCRDEHGTLMGLDTSVQVFRLDANTGKAHLLGFAFIDHQKVCPKMLEKQTCQDKTIM